jgi:hypothetical protein
MPSFARALPFREIVSVCGIDVFFLLIFKVLPVRMRSFYQQFGTAFFGRKLSKLLQLGMSMGENR